ncbi:MAG TPA: plastocyanin/azurin family copper-binding protein [Actinomycetota bacterium]|nr:plastocyanin/azurin family copper-binding protein [Actinomycetota bacterium]
MGAHPRHRRAAGLAAVAVLALSTSACGGEDDQPDVAAHAHDHDHSHDAPAAGFAFGAPGDPADATRTVEVAATAPFRFDPEDLELNTGETVTFVISNDDDVVHEFVLGDRDYQDAHEEEMAAGAMHHEGNAVTVAPGDTEELTWTFPAAGEVLYGCHVAGHYDQGMVGTIDVSA